MRIGVVVATFGDKKYWKEYIERAVASVKDADELVVYHGESLSEARNTAISRLNTDYVISLDADDELAPNYIDKMRNGKGDIRFPRVKKISDESVQFISYDKGDLHISNYIVIGAMFRKDLFEKVGGFWDEPIWDDWSLWLRMEHAGATIEPNDATYIVHDRANSRNKNQCIDHEYWLKTIRGYVK